MGWLRRWASIPRPPAYEAGELPDCSTPPLDSNTSRCQDRARSSCRNEPMYLAFAPGINSLTSQVRFYPVKAYTRNSTLWDFGYFKLCRLHACPAPAPLGTPLGVGTRGPILLSAVLALLFLGGHSLAPPSPDQQRRDNYQHFRPNRNERESHCSSEA